MLTILQVTGQQRIPWLHKSIMLKWGRNPGLACVMSSDKKTWCYLATFASTSVFSIDKNWAKEKSSSLHESLGLIPATHTYTKKDWTGIRNEKFDSVSSFPPPQKTPNKETYITIGEFKLERQNLPKANPVSHWGEATACLL
jgi:hypothetical protein